ncbi:hypothetical protein pb186bvf_012775 [Paramecium bursaria]
MFVQRQQRMPSQPPSAQISVSNMPLSNRKDMMSPYYRTEPKQQYIEQPLRLVQKEIFPQIQVPQIQQAQPQNIDINELTNYLEDLQGKYDKMAIQLQNAAQREMLFQQQTGANYQELTNKLVAIQGDRDRLQQALLQKEEENRYLQASLTAIREQFTKEILQNNQENDRRTQTLTDKLDQMNSFVKEKMLEFEQTKAILQLREQEVQEWRNRKANDSSPEVTQLQMRVKQLQQERDQLLQQQRIQSSNQQSFIDQNEVAMLRAQLEEKDQELKTLRIKYDYKQKTQPNEYNEEEDHQKEILQNEIKRLNQKVIELKNELANAHDKVGDTEFLKSKVVQLNKSQAPRVAGQKRSQYGGSQYSNQDSQFGGTNNQRSQYPVVQLRMQEL